MRIREWANNSRVIKSYSEVDLVINEIIKTYYEICFLFVGNLDAKNLDELLQKIEYDSKNINQNFASWINAEGSKFLKDISSTYIEDDKVIEEELKYIVFILKSELSNMDKYSSEVIVTLADITESVYKILKIKED